MGQNQILASVGAVFIAGGLFLGTGSDADIGTYHRLQACVTDFDNVPDCNDNVDNDGDGFTDMADGSCTDLSDPSEGVCIGETETRGLGASNVSVSGQGSLSAGPVSSIQSNTGHRVQSSDSTGIVSGVISGPGSIPTDPVAGPTIPSNPAGANQVPLPSAPLPEDYDTDQDIGRKKPACNNGNGNGSEGCSPSQNGNDDEIFGGVVHGTYDPPVKGTKGVTNQ